MIERVVGDFKDTHLNQVRLMEYNEMSDEDKRSCCWQLAYWGYGSSPRWSDMEGGFNVDEIDIEYFMNYVRKVLLLNGKMFESIL